jgi:hypothetical protein
MIPNSTRATDRASADGTYTIKKEVFVLSQNEKFPLNSSFRSRYPMRFSG